MAQTIQVLSEASIRKLKADHDRLARIVQELRQQVTQQARFANPIPFLIGKAAADIAPGESGDVDIWRVWNGVVEAAGYAETAYDWFGTGAIAGAKLQLWKHQQSGRLYFNMHLPLLAVADAAVSEGANGTFSVFNGTPGSESDSTSNVTANSAFGDLALGDLVWLSHNGDGWYAISARCAA